VSFRAWTVGGGGAGVPAVGYSESSPGYCEYSHVLKVDTVSTRTCVMRRFADVIFRLDRRRRWCRRTCGGVLDVLTVGYSESSQGYCEYSRTPKGTVSTRTCGMRRCARVIQSLDRRRRWCRRTCGGVLGVLTVGYSEYAQGRAAHTAGAHECRRSGHMLQNQEKNRKCQGMTRADETRRECMQGRGGH
jgi:hypothetical protein